MDETISTLRIDIGASSDKAISEIDKVASSLQKLRNAASGKMSGFSKLADELKKVADVARGLEDSYGALAKTAQALERLSNIRSISIPKSLGDNIRNIGLAAEMISPDAVANLDSMTRSLQRLNNTNSKSLIASLGKQMRDLEKPVKINIDTASVAKSSKTVSGFASLLSSLKRITMYRILRTIIKEIGAALKEGSENAYFFSKSIGGDLAQALDTLSTKNYTLTNQFGAAWATLLQTVQPILLQIIAAVTRVMQIITQFFAVLGGKSTYLKAIDYSKDWANATTSGAKAAKEWKNQLLGFDEINKLEAPSEGGSGSGNQLPDYSKMFEETQIEGFIQKIKDSLVDLELFALGAALAVGLFLVFSGTNIPLGLALVAFGAYNIASVVSENWGEVNNKVEGLLRNINIIAAGALFGIGLMLAFSGNIPIGIALMAIGALQFANVLAVSWDEMPKKIKSTIKTIDAILGVSLLGIGVILAFTSPTSLPLAIGLIAAGAAMLASSVAISWTEMPDKVKQQFQTIMGFVSKALIALGVIFLFVPGMQGWGIGALIAGGVASLATAFSFDPEGTIQAILHPIETLKAAFWDLWGTVVQVWNEIIGFFSWLSGASASNIANAEANGSIYLTGFASGGFPEDGLFMANHGELVGQFSNGKTAVVNNNQIVEGVAEGVAEAVSSVLSGMQMNSNQPVNVRVYLDSREIKSGQQRLARATGSA